MLSTQVSCVKETLVFKAQDDCQTVKFICWYLWWYLRMSSGICGLVCKVKNRVLKNRPSKNRSYKNRASKNSISKDSSPQESSRQESSPEESSPERTHSPKIDCLFVCLFMLKIFVFYFGHEMFQFVTPKPLTKEITLKIFDPIISNSFPVRYYGISGTNLPDIR